MRRRIMVLGFFCLACPVLLAQPPEAMIRYEKLDNQAVVKMVKDGIPEEAIIQEIRMNPGQFDLSTGAVGVLKKAGVSDAVIAAMRAGVVTPPKVAPAAPPQRLVLPPAPRVVAKMEPPPGPAPAPRDPVRTTPPPAPVPREVSPSPAPAPDPSPRTDNRPDFARWRVEERETPRAEIFAGLSITRSATEGNIAGWNAAVTGNVTRSFGFVGDVSRQSQTLMFLGHELGNGSIYMLLFGPQFSFRSDRFHGFGRGLFGTSHNTVPARTGDAWALAYGFGGGLDLGVSSGFALRLLQWDVVTRNLERRNRTDHRLSFGGVVQF